MCQDGGGGGVRCCDREGGRRSVLRGSAGRGCQVRRGSAAGRAARSGRAARPALGPRCRHRARERSVPRREAAGRRQHPGPAPALVGLRCPAREPRMAPVCPVGPGGERDGWWGRAVLTRLVVAASQEEGAPRGPAHSSPGCRDLFTRRQLPWLFFVCHPYELSAAV